MVESDAILDLSARPMQAHSTAYASVPLTRVFHQRKGSREADPSLSPPTPEGRAGALEEPPSPPTLKNGKSPLVNHQLISSHLIWHERRPPAGKGNSHQEKGRQEHRDEMKSHSASHAVKPKENAIAQLSKRRKQEKKKRRKEEEEEEEEKNTSSGSR